MKRACLGFTLIELVIAISITVVMVVFVYSATQGMARSARRQQELKRESEKWQIFENLLRRDVRGWYIQKKDSNVLSTTAVDPNETRLLTFTSTCDSLAASAVRSTDDSLPALQHSGSTVIYVARKQFNEYRIQRVQGGLELPLLSTKALPEVEYYDGKRWITQWTQKDRPTAVRIKVEEKQVFIAL